MTKLHKERYSIVTFGGDVHSIIIGSDVHHVIVDNISQCIVLTLVNHDYNEIVRLVDILNCYDKGSNLKLRSNFYEKNDNK